MNVKNLNLFFKIYKENTIPECFSSLTTFDKVYPNKEFKKAFKIYHISFIPFYIGLKVNSDFVKLSPVKQSNLGYAMSLNNFKNKDEYINKILGRKAKNIRRLSRKLEQCFTINYLTFYGDIEIENFKFLIRRLREMIEIRFKQRGQTNDRLAEWESIEQDTFSLILEKKASLFVIYNKDEPIEISLSYHFNDLQFSAISSYDINYEKFSLGSIHFYQIIDWCIEQNITIFEMGFGDLDYKRKWSNLIYNYSHGFLYAKGSKINSFKSRINWILIFIKELLKKSWLFKIRNNLIRFLNTRKPNISGESQFYHENLIEAPYNFDNYSKINFDDFTFPSSLKKLIYEFQFAHNCHTNNLKIYQSKTNKANYMLNYKSIFNEVTKI